MVRSGVFSTETDHTGCKNYRIILITRFATIRTRWEIFVS